MDELWGYVIVAVVIAALLARAWVSYSRYRADRSMIEMNERDKRR